MGIRNFDLKRDPETKQLLATHISNWDPNSGKIDWKLLTIKKKLIRK